jgi:long-chain acyl-CoA synthetase
MACLKAGGTVNEMDQVYKEKGNTWPKILSYNYRKYGNKHKAMRFKYHGIWQPVTWTDYYLDVKYLSLGLLSLGFSSGDKLLIVGDNAPQWYSAELAAQSNRGLAVGAGPDLTAAEIRHSAQDSEITYAVVEDQEQVDKLLEIKDELPLLRKIVYWNYKGLSHYEDPLLIGYKEVVLKGKEFEQEHQGIFEANVEAGKPEDRCAIVYTSGTTRTMPKGAVHTYLSMMTSTLACLRIDPWLENDSIVPFLPPAWMAEQLFAVGCHLLSGCTINFPEAPETRVRDAKEIRATIAFHGARFWESRSAMLRARIIDSRGVKKIAFRALMPAGYRVADLELQGTEPGFLSKALYCLGNIVLFRRMRESLGVSKIRIAYSTGSVLSPDALRFYHAIGVPLKSIYVTTEGGVLIDSAKDNACAGAAAGLIRDVEIRISDNGELCYRGPGCFSGYCGNADQTSDVFEDGWFRSGDSAIADKDGRIVFVDRLNSLIELTNGEKVSPQALESKLRASPYIRDAWIIGHRRSYLAAIIVINYATVSKWAGQKRIAFNTFGELTQTKEVHELISEEIERGNTVTRGSRIEKFVNLTREFDPDEGELTRTGHLRRGVLDNHFGSIIDAIYAEESEVSIETRIRYQDGHEGKRKSTLSVWTVKGVS